MSGFDGLGDNGFGQFFGGNLNHIDCVFSSAHQDIQIALVHLLMGGIDNELAINASDTAGARGAVEGNFADGQGRTGSYHRRNIRVVFLVGAED